MTAPVVFVDTETTGLDPDIHEVWEVGVVEADGTEHRWCLYPRRLANASPDALRISRFYERPPADTWDNPIYSAREIARLTAGMHLVGAVPSFDAAFLTKFLREQNMTPAWHYHLVDVEALVAGKLGLEPPWNSQELSRRIGVEPTPDDEKHTALGDARWAKRMYEKALGLA